MLAGLKGLDRIVTAGCGADPVYKVIQIIVAYVLNGVLIAGFNAVVEVASPHQHLSITHALPLEAHQQNALSVCRHCDLRP